jgi:hypothetical protein
MFELLQGGTCSVEKAATMGGISFGILVVVATAIFLYIFSKIEKKFLAHFAIIAFGVFIFELFTSPMWENSRLGEWAYIYHDVSWILTIGWSTLILSVILLVDKFFKNLHEWKRFFLYMAGMALVGFLAEVAVVNLGLRTYSPEVLNALWGLRIWNVPIEALYYIPVFSALVIGFYKYWVNVINQKAIVPERRKRWGRSLIVSIFAVLLFELMIEPMVVNMNLPDWSYIYRDISFLMTGGWIIIVWLAIGLVDKVFIHYNLTARFMLYILGGSIIALPLESWFISSGYRVYGETAASEFSGFTLPFTSIPLEVIIAVPLYLVLIIAFIRYWEIVLSAKK